MGTPDFAAIILEKILQSGQFEVKGVFTQPDRLSGRGLKYVPSEVKTLALANDLPLFQPASLRNPEIYEEIAKLRPDFLIVASYGIILPQNVLDIPTVAPINVHASLLPKYRGAAPIQAAIMENWGPDAETGVSIMKMEAGLDTGPVYSTVKIPIGRLSCQELRQQLAKVGASLLLDSMEKIIHGELQPLPQDESRATYAPKLHKEDGIIKWDAPCGAVDAFVRAVTSWPGAQTMLQFNESLPVRTIIISGQPVFEKHDAKPGEIFREKTGLKVACSDGWYEIHELRTQGGKKLKVSNFINGLRGCPMGFCGVAYSE